MLNSGERCLTSIAGYPGSEMPIEKGMDAALNRKFRPPKNSRDTPAIPDLGAFQALLQCGNDFLAVQERFNGFSKRFRHDFLGMGRWIELAAT